MSRIFKVNGEPIFIRGGNWILSDGLLRLTKKRYMTDIKFHADMNFNMLRCWGGGLAERPDFYHFCDVYGLMVSLNLSPYQLVVMFFVRGIAIELGYIVLTPWANYIQCIGLTPYLSRQCGPPRACPLRDQEEETIQHLLVSRVFIRQFGLIFFRL
jgi:hypothetical protein